MSKRNGNEHHQKNELNASDRQTLASSRHYAFAYRYLYNYPYPVALPYVHVPTINHTYLTFTQPFIGPCYDHSMVVQWRGAIAKQKVQFAIVAIQSVE
jgi:hypothetical protein